MKTIKLFQRLILALVLVISTFSFVKAQEDDDVKINVKDFSTLSLDELNAHRNQLISMVNSSEFQKKVNKIDNLKIPNDSGIPSLDNLTALIAKMTGKVQENRSAIASMYSNFTGQNYDGSAITKATVDQQQLNSLAGIMLQMNGEIITTAKSLIDLPGEIKNAGGLKALKGLKNLMFIKNAVSALSAEIKFNNQLTQNLLATQKLSQK